MGGCLCTRPLQNAQQNLTPAVCGSLDGLIGLGLTWVVINSLLPFAPSAVLVSVLWVNLGKSEELILDVRNTGVLHGHIVDMGGAALTSRLISSSHFTKCNTNSGCP